MKSSHATVLAFAAAIVFPAAVQAVIDPLTGHRDLPSIAGTFFVASYFASVAVMLLGVPPYVVLKRLHFVTWWTATAWGAGTGSLVSLALTSSFVPEAQVSFVMLGAATGFLFWVIWKQGRE